MNGIGERIRALRENRGWSQSALARYAGISQPVIFALESGEQQTTRKLPDIARALGVPVSALDPRLGGEGSNAGSPGINDEYVALSDVRDALFAIVGKLDISDIAAEILVQTILQRLKDRRSPPAGVSRSAAVRTFVHDKVDEFAEQPPDRNQR